MSIPLHRLGNYRFWILKFWSDLHFDYSWWYSSFFCVVFVRVWIIPLRERKTDKSYCILYLCIYQKHICGGGRKEKLPDIHKMVDCSRLGAHSKWLATSIHVFCLGNYYKRPAGSRIKLFGQKTNCQYSLHFSAAPDENHRYLLAALILSKQTLSKTPWIWRINRDMMLEKEI